MGWRSWRPAAGARPAFLLATGIATMVGLTGCLAGGGSGSTATTVITTPATVSPAPAVTPAAVLAREACQQYAANPHPSTAAYPGYFAADAEVDLAERLNPSTQWSTLASGFDAVKAEIQQIDQLQSGAAQSYSSSANAVTLAQALGSLNGDLAAVATLCAAYRL